MTLVPATAPPTRSRMRINKRTSLRPVVPPAGSRLSRRIRTAGEALAEVEVEEV